MANRPYKEGCIRIWRVFLTNAPANPFSPAWWAG